MWIPRPIIRDFVAIADWLCDQLFILCKLLHIFFGVFFACILSKEFLLMGCVLTCAWGAAWPRLHLPYALDAACLKEINDWRIGSLACMFDLGKILDLLGSKDVAWTSRIIPVLQYLATWLMGGGILLGIIIGHGGGYLLRARDGYCRYRAFLRKHSVVLGWEPNTITLMRELTERRKRVCRLWPFSRAWWRRPRVVVLTKDSAVAVNRQMQKAYDVDSMWARILFKLPFSRVIYNGSYDDTNEFKNVNIPSATEVFITGEQDEEGHDCHVLMAVAALNKFAERKCNKNIKVRLRIASPILHHQIMNRKLSCENLDVDYFNFHVNWAHGLWLDDGRAKLDNASNNCKFDLIRREQTPGSRKDKMSVLVVVGMGRMGLAIVERAMEIARGLEKKLSVWIVDPNKDDRKEQLKTAYKEDVDICKAYCTFNYIDGRSDSRTFNEKFAELVSSGEPVIVAVTLSRPDKALECAFSIDRAVRDLKARNVSILLRQNVDVDDDKDCSLMPANSFGVNDMCLFGFQNGAGYGAIRKEKKQHEES